MFKALPFDGDIGDQPEYVAEAIEVCEQEAVRYESEMRARDIKKAQVPNV